MKDKFNVEGMTCASCQTHVEEAVRKIPGVESVNVNLLQNTMDVSYDEKRVNSKMITTSVSKEGYKAFKDGEKTNIESKSNNMLVRLLVSLVFSIVLMYVAMGKMIGIPTPSYFESNKLGFVFLQLLLLIPVIVVNYSYFVDGYNKLIKLKPNMNSLVSLGATASTLYGVVSLFIMFDAVISGNNAVVNEYASTLYFDSAAMILTFVTLGKFLESKSKDKTKEAIESLVKLSPKEARVIENGKEIVKNVKDILINDIVLVKPYETIGMDGVIVDGETYINEANITGESMPVYKKKNDKVISSTINQNGTISFKVTSLQKDSTIQTIINLVNEASSSKAPISRLVDKVSLFFVPFVIAVSLLCLVIYTALGYPSSYVFNITISILVVSCPCALGLATPVAIMVGSGKGASLGLLIKSATSLETASKIKAIVFDKTGTLTKGKPAVKQIVNYSSLSEDELISLFYSLEDKSEHPLSNAVKEFASTHNINKVEVSEFFIAPGFGLKGKIKNEVYMIGSLSYVRNILKKNYEHLRKDVEKYSSSGYTPLVLFTKEKVLGMLLVQDEMKENSKKTIELLQSKNIEVFMLTGDNKYVAYDIGKKLGIKEENIFYEVLPSSKQDKILELKKKYQYVSMVGDGVNDAPSLMSSSLGIAVKEGTEVAISSADIVLLHDDIMEVYNSYMLSRKVMTNIKINLFWAFFYNLVGITLATGAFASMKILINPMIAAILMSFSSVFVVTNSLFINTFKPYGKRKEKIKMEEKEFYVPDMMCKHCVAHIESALKDVPNVKKIDISLETKKVVVKGTDLDESVLIAAINKSGYEVKR